MRRKKRAKPGAPMISGETEIKSVAAGDGGGESVEIWRMSKRGDENSGEESKGTKKKEKQSHTRCRDFTFFIK